MEEEKVYIGTKIVNATKMSELDFLTSKNVAFQPNETNRDGYRVTYEDDYVSWSPKETFERAYREVTEAEKSMM